MNIESLWMSNRSNLSIVTQCRNNQTTSLVKNVVMILNIESQDLQSINWTNRYTGIVLEFNIGWKI